MEKMTIKEATQKWVGEFNAIPQSLITKAYPNTEDYEILITPKECTYCGNTEIRKNENNEEYCTSCERTDHIGLQYDFPMWGTMWTFGDSLDDDWAKENLEMMEDCGFWVYESDELGVFFGINGAGYDFYESHWIPLYKKRGLKWHDENEEE